jgi:hypothetical protein
MKMPDDILPSPSTTSLTAELPLAPEAVRARLMDQGAAVAHIESMVWLAEYALQQGIASYAQIGDLIGRDKTTMCRAFRGEYGSSLDRIVGAVDRFRRGASLRFIDGGRPMATLSVMQKVQDLCDLARLQGEMALLYGESQTGKTVALACYAAQERKPSERTVLVRMPRGGTTGLFMRDAVRACGLSERVSQCQLRDTLLSFLKPGMLLIVDEFHQCIHPVIKHTTVEQIRECRDIARCGVVICGTNVVRDAFEDEATKKFLGQTAKRGVLRRFVPTRPLRSDILSVCQAYGFPVLQAGPERDRAERIANDEGIGKLCAYLAFARRKATKRGEKAREAGAADWTGQSAPTWADFMGTLGMMLANEQGPDKEQTWAEAEASLGL